MNIKSLKLLFDKLPVSSDNINLYYELLRLDISDFKPLMEQILAGRIDIEDTRKIFNSQFVTAFDRLFSDPIDARISTDIAITMSDNILERLFGDGNDLVKENLGFIQNIEDYKSIIAETYYKETGIELDKEQIDKILPIVQREYMQELSLLNLGSEQRKEMQLAISDYLAYTPLM